MIEAGKLSVFDGGLVNLVTFSISDKSRVLVLGMGLSGRSAARFLLSHGASVVGVDRNRRLFETEPDIQVLGALGLKTMTEEECGDVTHFDFVVASPGVPGSHPLLQKANLNGVEVMGEIELGCRLASQGMIAITGTNGKTTTTLLTEHVLAESGRKVKALGNVGAPLTQELLALPADVNIVLELSSFQLESLMQQRLHGGVILNITPDHLDRYASMDDYAKAKCRLEDCLAEGAPLYIEEGTYSHYSHFLKRGSSHRLYGYHPSSYIYSDLNAVYREGIKAFDLPSALCGKRSHDLENSMAAYALCADQDISGEQFLMAWMTYQKPPHRIEFVLEHGGVKYFDDSKGTNIDAVIRAVQALPGPIILIAGGVDKGGAYTPWLREFKNKVKSICAIGQAAGKIQDQLHGEIAVMTCSTMQDAVEHAQEKAVPGDTILLSPGCSSYDMYRDYVHRGEDYQSIVRKMTC
jgi:UDP-N-acetylmuramoylalanine--D-glutamate ligase